MRKIDAIKVQTSARQEGRTQVLYNLAQGKMQNSIILARRLMMTSLKLYNMFGDGHAEEFEQQCFLRTNKAIQLLEYSLDQILMCKVLILAKKKSEAIDLLQTIEVPWPEKQNPAELPSELAAAECPINRQRIVRFNELKEINSRTCAVLLTLIDMATQLKQPEQAEELYQSYLKYVRKYYTRIEEAAVIFKFANYLIESGELERAEAQYEKCIKIRRSNVINESLIDAFVNLAICLMKMGKQAAAISRMEEALNLYESLSLPKDERMEDLQLFLSKLKLETGDFEGCYEQLLLTFLSRLREPPASARRIEAELIVMLAVRTLEEVLQSPETTLSCTSRRDILKKQADAETALRRFKTGLMAHGDFRKYLSSSENTDLRLTLCISEDFFALLSADQVSEANELISRAEYQSKQHGLSDLHKSTFYNDPILR